MKLDHLVLAVADLEASLPYYERLLVLLGFTKTRKHVWVNEHGFGLELRQAKDPAHAYKREGVGLNHLAVGAESREAVDEVARQMKERASRCPPRRSSAGRTRSS